MSGEHPVHAWRYAIRTPREFQNEHGIGATARQVAMELSCWMNPDGEFWPGAFTLARATGLSERTVRTQLGELEAKGWIVKLEQGGLRGGTSSYRPDGSKTSTKWRAATPARVSVVTPAAGAALGRVLARPTPATDASTAATGAATPATDASTAERASDELGVELGADLGHELASLTCTCGAGLIATGKPKFPAACRAGCGVFTEDQLARVLRAEAS